MPSPVSVTLMTALGPMRAMRECDPTAGRRELDGVGGEVPDHLLQAIGIAEHGAVEVRVRLELHALGGRRRTDGIERRVDDRRQLHRPQLETQLAGHDARDVEDVGDQLFLDVRVALDGLQRAGHRGAVQLAHAQQPRPAEHGIQRRAQLVGQRGEEILFRAIGGRELLGAPPEIVFEPLALGDVANDQRKTLERPLAAAPHRCDDDVRVERRPAAPHAETLAGEPAALLGGAEMLGGNVEIALGGLVEASRSCGR